MNAQEWQELANSDPIKYAQERAKELNAEHAISDAVNNVISIDRSDELINDKVRIIALEKRLVAVEAKLADINEKNAKLMQADYTRKTMALAEERKVMKRQHDEIMAKMAALQERLKAYESCEKEMP